MSGANSLQLLVGMASSATAASPLAEDACLPKEKPPSEFFESKTFRLISIALYLGGISGLGMVLALYYILFFDSGMPEIHLKFPVSIGGQPVQKVQQYQ